MDLVLNELSYLGDILPILSCSVFYLQLKSLVRLRKIKEARDVLGKVLHSK